MWKVTSTSKIYLVLCATVFLLCKSAGQKGDDDAENESSIPEDFGMAVKDGGTQIFHDDDFIVTKGVIAERWRSSCREVQNERSDGEEACEVQTFGEYQDQVTFEFMYSDASLYKFKQATVSSSGGRAEPRIQDFSNDVEEKTGEITVRHGCSATSSGEAAISEIVLTFPLDDTRKIRLSWDKVCGFGNHTKLDYGWLGGVGGDLSKAISFRDDPSGKSTMIFGPSVLSTRVYLRLESGAESQYYEAPVVEAIGVSDGSDVGVEVRGSNFGGVVLRSSYSVFDVMYNCYSKGKSFVSVRVGIAPYKAIRMGWRKDCGGGVATGVNVGTVGRGWGYVRGTGDVVVGGVAIGGYAERGNGSWGESGTLVRHRKRVGNRVFYVWGNRNEVMLGGGEEIGEVSAHGSDERVLSCGVRVSGEGGGLVGGRGKRVVVWTRCNRRGRARVGVTMSVRDRDAVEWWFDEECGRERLRGRRRGWRVTAGQVMYVTLGMFAMAMVAWMGKAWTVAGKHATRGGRLGGWRRVQV